MIYDSAMEVSSSTADRSSLCGGDGGGDGDDVGLMDESIDEGGGDVIAGTTTRVRRPCNGHLTAAASRTRAQGDGSGARWRPGPYRRRLVV